MSHKSRVSLISPHSGNLWGGSMWLKFTALCSCLRRLYPTETQCPSIPLAPLPRPPHFSVFCLAILSPTGVCLTPRQALGCHHQCISSLFLPGLAPPPYNGFISFVLHCTLKSKPEAVLCVHVPPVFLSMLDA